VISVTGSYLEILYMEYTSMPSPIYRYVINLIVRLAVRRGPGVFVNVQCRNIMLLTARFFYVAKVKTRITTLMQILIPNCQFENILSPQS
jgi:hypothetical protein